MCSARHIPSSINEMHGGKGHACVRHAAYPLQLLSKTRSVLVPGTHSSALRLLLSSTFQEFPALPNWSKWKSKKKLEKSNTKKRYPLWYLTDRAAVRKVPRAARGVLGAREKLRDWVGVAKLGICLRGLCGGCGGAERPTPAPLSRQHRRSRRAEWRKSSSGGA